MTFLKKYQKFIATFIVILLLLEFGIYPCLTMANTFANIIGAIGLLAVCIWAILTFGASFDDNSIEKTEIKELGETELDYIPKPKTKATRKPKTTKTK
jgi:hypothetical protein